MNVHSFFSRFEEVRDIYIGKNLSFSRKLFYYIDWLFAYFIHGASINDYFAFGFYDLRYSGRSKYITYRKYLKIQKFCNKKDDIILCRDKIQFNEYFSDYIGRKWLNMKTATFEEFESFLQENPVFFVKDIYGYRGLGVRKFLSSQVDGKILYEELHSSIKSHYILEEEIKEINDLHEFHPWSINTIRIITIYDDVCQDVKIINARIRIGNNKNAVDTLHYGGIGANIDIDTGIINSMGRDAKNRRYIFHPITQKQIVGFQVPYWKECISYITNVAKLLPTVRYVGWDIVIQPNGSFLLIEANDNADHDFQQLFCGGLWPKYKKYL